MHPLTECHFICFRSFWLWQMMPLWISLHEILFWCIFHFPWLCRVVGSCGNSKFTHLKNFQTASNDRNTYTPTEVCKGSSFSTFISSCCLPVPWFIITIPVGKDELPLRLELVLSLRLLVLGLLVSPDLSTLFWRNVYSSLILFLFFKFIAFWLLHYWWILNSEYYILIRYIIFKLFSLILQRSFTFSIAASSV